MRGEEEEGEEESREGKGERGRGRGFSTGPMSEILPLALLGTNGVGIGSGVPPSQSHPKQT